jgi:CDP-6-deoxy-D-xylo-4-hexulose-3-dehydrase
MRVIRNSGKVYEDIDKNALLDFIARGEEIPYGPSYELFEEKLALYAGVKYAFFVNSGSSANLLALAIFSSPQMRSKWRIHPGDEIITLAASFPTTIAPIVQYGCVPVFVDIDIPSYNINIESLERAYSPKTRGVFIAHTLGNPFDITKVQEFCTLHDLFLITDGCDALGSEYKGKSVLSYGQVSTLSMYAAHNIFTGQGGAVFTDDPALAELIRSFRGWGRLCHCRLNEDNACGNRFSGQWGTLPQGYDHKYTYNNFGYNLMATNIQAALGLAQISRVDTFSAQRRKNFRYLYNFIRNTGLPITLPESLADADPVWFGFSLLFKPGLRGKMAEYLEGRGVQTRHLFAGNITRQPLFTENNIPYRVVGNLDNTDHVMNNLLWVGCFHGLDESDMRYIGEAVVGSMHDCSKH